MDLGRRMVQEVEGTRLPRARGLIEEVCPDAKLDYRIDWSSFDGDPDAIDALWLVVEHPAYAVRKVCTDAVGRKAIACGLRHIVLRNVGTADAIGASFADGTLDVRMHVAEEQAGSPGYLAIARVLSAGL